MPILFWSYVVSYVPRIIDLNDGLLWGFGGEGGGNRKKKKMAVKQTKVTCDKKLVCHQIAFT